MGRLGIGSNGQLQAHTAGLLPAVPTSLLSPSNLTYSCLERLWLQHTTGPLSLIFLHSPCHRIHLLVSSTCPDCHTVSKGGQCVCLHYWLLSLPESLAQERWQDDQQRLLPLPLNHLPPLFSAHNIVPIAELLPTKPSVAPPPLR